MKTLHLTLVPFILSMAAPAFAERYDFSAVILANRTIDCGAQPAKLKAAGFVLFNAEETELSEDDHDYPTIVRKHKTVLAFGKDRKPMQGYTKIAQLEILTTENCIGDPAADGVCKETVTSCKRIPNASN